MVNDLRLKNIVINLFLVLLCSTLCSLKKTPNIAVIGGGIGGTSASYFLYQLFGPKGAHIDLYEPNKIGGRLAVTEVNGRYYEAGGSIIHKRNKYMADFLKVLGLKERETSSQSKFGLYDGKKFVFSESNWQILTLVKLAWRYGFGPLKLQHYVEDRLSNFEKIYGLQDNGVSYTSVSDLLKAMNPQFPDNLQITTKDGLVKEGFTDLLIDELVMATLTANYGQSTNVHEFVGSVSCAGANGELWSVHGGNRIIPEMLLQHSQATLIPARVTNITLRKESNDFLIHYMSTEDDKNSKKTSTYDIIVIATPMTQDTGTNIKFTNFPKKFDFPGRYHRTVCTMVHGNLNPSYFGFEKETDLLDEILTVKLGLDFNSVGRINPVDYKQSEGKFDVWKVFSQVPLTKDQLNALFMNHSSVDVIDWLAYPHYSTEKRHDQFVLHENLFHVNPIEWAASAMEMSAIGAKNAALLSYKSWHGIETPDVKTSIKEEL